MTEAPSSYFLTLDIVSMANKLNDNSENNIKLVKCQEKLKKCLLCLHFLNEMRYGVSEWELS